MTSVHALMSCFLVFMGVKFVTLLSTDTELGVEK